MTSYEKVFSRSRLKMNDLKEIMSLSDNDLLEINTERLHSVVSDVRVQYLFNSFSMNDEIQHFEYELKNPNTNAFFDEEFIIDLFATGMVISWLRPQVDSHEFISMMIGGKEEKSLNNQFKNVKERLNHLENYFHKLLRDRGYMFNSYIENR